MNTLEMTAVFESCDEGGYIAYIEEIPGMIEPLHGLRMPNKEYRFLLRQEINDNRNRETETQFFSVGD